MEHRTRKLHQYIQTLVPGFNYGPNLWRIVSVGEFSCAFQIRVQFILNCLNCSVLSLFSLALHWWFRPYRLELNAYQFKGQLMRAVQNISENEFCLRNNSVRILLAKPFEFVFFYKWVFRCEYCSVGIDRTTWNVTFYWSSSITYVLTV